MLVQIVFLARFSSTAGPAWDVVSVWLLQRRHSGRARSTPAVAYCCL